MPLKSQEIICVYSAHDKISLQFLPYQVLVIKNEASISPTFSASVGTMTLLNTTLVSYIYSNPGIVLSLPEIAQNRLFLLVTELTQLVLLNNFFSTPYFT